MGTSSQQNHPLDDATIGIVTALPKELAAVRAVFECNDDRIVPSRRPNTGVSYHIRNVAARCGGSHAVAISTLVQIGNNTASAATMQLVNDCPNVNQVIMVGIAGAVPHPTDAENHVRLGDIVISNENGAIQFDSGKRHEKKGFEYRGFETRPSALLLSAVRNLQAGAELGEYPWEGHISRAVAKHEKFRRPTMADILIDDIEAIPHPDDSEWRRADQPRVFLGPIGSSNILLKDAGYRNQLREKYGVKAIEMEAAGVADAMWLGSCGYLIIRGTCDYCNKHKNDNWQRYAAIVAAAYARALVEYIPGRAETSARSRPLPPTVEENLSSLSVGNEGKTPLQRLPNSHRSASDASLAKEEVERLIKAVTHAWKILERRDAVELSRKLELVVEQRNDELPPDLLRSAYVTLANSALTEAKLDGKGSDAIYISKARQFIERAKDAKYSK